MSYTFTLTAKDSTLQAYITPPIILNENDEYVIALLNFESFNSIPNVDDSNNKLYIVGEDKPVVEIPEGSYEIDDINQYLQTELKKHNITISIIGYNTTLKTHVKCDKLIDFTPKDSIAKILGFKNRPLTERSEMSDVVPDIFKVNSICITCNLVSGSYISGIGEREARDGHIIHQLFPNVPPGAKIVEHPSNLIYLPINTRIIDFIILHIVDQNGEPINFRGERVTVRLHLKKSL